jgi:hypothetical protein
VGSQAPQSMSTAALGAVEQRPSPEQPWCRTVRHVAVHMVLRRGQVHLGRMCRQLRPRVAKPAEHNKVGLN